MTAIIDTWNTLKQELSSTLWCNFCFDHQTKPLTASSSRSEVIKEESVRSRTFTSNVKHHLRPSYSGHIAWTKSSHDMIIWEFDCETCSEDLTLSSGEESPFPNVQLEEIYAWTIAALGYRWNDVRGAALNIKMSHAPPASPWAGSRPAHCVSPALWTI